MTEIYDFRPFEDHYSSWESTFSSGQGTGEFSFYPGKQPDIYGATDMVFNRFILGQLEHNSQNPVNQAWAEHIHNFQNPRTGWYKNRYNLTHFREHTAAYACASLVLLGFLPKYPIRKAMKISQSPESMEKWLNTVPWSMIWPGSHIVSGLPAILHMTGEGTEEFFHWYFDWLDSTASPETGYWSRGLAHKMGLVSPRRKQEMGGAFHMYYVYEARKRTWKYNEAIVDATLALQHANGLWDKNVPYCIDLDGVYCLLRSSRNAGGYKKDEVFQTCCRFLSTAAAVLNDSQSLYRLYHNSHKLPGALAAIAECSVHYPDLVKTTVPWRQSLDYACFI